MSCIAWLQYCDDFLRCKRIKNLLFRGFPAACPIQRRCTICHRINSRDPRKSELMSGTRDCAEHKRSSHRRHLVQTFAECRGATRIGPSMAKKRTNIKGVAGEKGPICSASSHKDQRNLSRTHLTPTTMGRELESNGAPIFSSRNEPNRWHLGKSLTGASFACVCCACQLYIF